MLTIQYTWAAAALAVAFGSGMAVGIIGCTIWAVRAIEEE